METRGAFHFVTPIGPGLQAKGKGSKSIVTSMTRALGRQGVDSEVVTSDELLERGPARHARAHVVLHYNELTFSRSGHHDALRDIETRLRDQGYTLHHGSDSALIIADKRRQNTELSAAGVPMPARIIGQSGDRETFTNEAMNAHTDVAILPPGTPVDETRYNAEYIDTVHHSMGRDYYTSIRSLCFGKTVLVSWMRTNDAASGNPNVRSRTTRPDAQVIADLHERLVKGNRRQLRRIAAGVADRLGANFYAHDLLPCARTGKLYLCETNFKFYEGMYRWQMKPIKDEHPVGDMFNGRRFARRASRVIVSELFPEPAPAARA